MTEQETNLLPRLLEQLLIRPVWMFILNLLSPPVVLSEEQGVENQRERVLIDMRVTRHPAVIGNID